MTDIIAVGTLSDTWQYFDLVIDFHDHVFLDKCRESFFRFSAWERPVDNHLKFLIRDNFATYNLWLYFIE